MKILNIIPNLKKGGAERLALNNVNSLQSVSNIEGQLITILSENDYKFLTKTINWRVITAKVIPSLSRKSIVEIKQLQDYLDTFQPDFIHSHLFETKILLPHISLTLKIKRIIHFHDNMHQFCNFQLKTLFNKTYLRDFFEKRIVLKNYPENTTAICISKDAQQFAYNVLTKGILKNLFNNAIDLVRFPLVEKQINTNEITMIGSLADKKKQQLSIDYISEFINRGVELHLNILGAGVNRNVLQNQIDQLRL